MKKKSQKKDTVSKSPVNKRAPLTLAAVILLLANTLLIVSVVILVIFIRVNSLLEVRGIESQIPVKFSYFIRRPDLLSSSKALVIYDSTNDVILLSKNKNLRFSPASTAKIMSALVALEHYKKDTVLSVEFLNGSKDSSKMGLSLGERISVLNLIYGMLLPSGNDAATLLAESYPGGKEAFVKRMNEKAKELELLNTYFTDPAGYDDTNYSNAQDLSRLGAEALKNPIISEVVKTQKIVVYSADKKISHKLENLNELLTIAGVNGVKTGFTNEAEGVLVTSFKYNGKEYLIVVLRSKDRFQDTYALIEGIVKDLKDESFNL